MGGRKSEPGLGLVCKKVYSDCMESEIGVEIKFNKTMISLGTAMEIAW
ncbi:hypothetical protein GCM10011413_04780 [Pedobacter psychrotolerans]|uniref:Uncharacterized protein n=1 Tax=Pedobacter psychrotolerans TaxID=1843235 RepID=A0ABQ1SLF9_9SPHI|nr:hypothetical protein GCM10011413_04780 [Pedobacter psychrotolerans]